MTKEDYYNACYDVLVREVGANPKNRFQFLTNLYHDPRITEWRFSGCLGFGGKLRQDRGKLFVTNYPEDQTPEKEAMIQRANEALAKLCKDS